MRRQLTPWHPELGRKKAIVLCAFYLLCYGGGWLLVFWICHARLR